MSYLYWVVLKKELRESLRDMRSTAIPLIFGLLFSLMVVGMLAKTIDRESKAEKEEVILLVNRAEQAPTLMAQLKQAGIKVELSRLTSEDEIAKKLEDSKITALLILDENYKTDFVALRTAKMVLWTNSATEQRQKIQKIKRYLDRYQMATLEWRMVSRGIPPVLLQPVQVQQYDVASLASRSSVLAGAFSMLFWMVLVYASSIIIDTTAGERERRTLELLIAQPVSAWQVVIGKWLAGSVFGVVGVILEFGSLHLFLINMPLEEIGVSWKIGLFGLLQIILSCIPLAMLGSVLYMVFAMNTKTFKEAQATVTGVMVLPIVPAIVFPMLDLGKQTWMYAVPMISNNEMLKMLMAGKSPSFFEWFLLFSVPSLLTMALVWFCAKRLRSEHFVIGV